MTPEAKQELERFVESLGLLYKATFVPTPQPLVKHPQLHWKIELEGRVKSSHRMVVPYSEGCAHVKGYQQVHKTPYDKYMHDRAIREACETGKYAMDMTVYINQSAFVIRKEQPAPELLDVLYCLVSDASVLEHPTFESWASEYGYDTDSRQAEDTYRACLELSLQLRALLGNDNLEKLQELFQDY